MKKEDVAGSDSQSSNQGQSETQEQKQKRADKQGRSGDLAATGESIDPTLKSKSHPMSSNVTDKAPSENKGRSQGKGKEEERSQQSKPTTKPDNEQQGEQLKALPMRTRKDMNVPPHVLFVEDNFINQKLVARQLAKKKFTVSTAKNGREAVDFVIASFSDPENAGKDDETKKQGEIDIILMDQEMPVMDGSAAAKEIRRREKEMGREKRVPILGVSANVREEQLQEMAKFGMDEFITKPYMVDDMIKKIGSMIDQ